MKVGILSIIALCFILGCSKDQNDQDLAENDQDLVEFDRSVIAGIAASAVIKERPHLTPAELPLLQLKLSYEYRNRTAYPVKQLSWPKQTWTKFITTILFVKPSATLIRGVSGGGNKFSVYCYEEAVVTIRTNRASDVDFILMTKDETSSHPKYATVIEGDELWNIVETALRHMFTNYPTGTEVDAPARFISVLGRDPPDSFLQRFNFMSDSVLPGSAFETGKGRKRYSVSIITALGEDSLTVLAGCYVANLCSNVDRLTLRKENGEWRVIKAKHILES